IEHPRDLKKRNAASPEDVSNFRYGTCLTMGEPFACHLRAIAEAIEPVIIDGGSGRQIEDDDRHLCTPHYWEDRRRQRIGRDVQKYHINIRSAELMACPQCLFGIVT